jgi:hypothetical protein
MTWVLTYLLLTVGAVGGFFVCALCVTSGRCSREEEAGEARRLAKGWVSRSEAPLPALH